MKAQDKPPAPPELPPAASRAVRLIYFAMGVMMLLPILVVWLTGSLQF